MIFRTAVGFLFLLFSLSSMMAQVDDIAGRYLAVDDRGGEPKSVVEVYFDGKSYRAKVIELLPEAVVRTCDGCSGSDKGASLVGMDIFWGLTMGDKDFRNGEILDPRSGKTYSLLAYIEDDFLVVRGYIGVPLFGLSLRWQKVDG